jgi:hypothetical protein
MKLAGSVLLSSVSFVSSSAQPCSISGLCRLLATPNFAAHADREHIIDGVNQVQATLIDIFFSPTVCECAAQPQR